MSYELWDTESGNCLDVYSSKTAAISFVKSVMEQFGDDAVEHWELLRMDVDKDPVSVAFGKQLADLAQGRASTAV